jgi:hypothetical protein
MASLQLKAVFIDAILKYIFVLSKYFYVFFINYFVLLT